MIEDSSSCGELFNEQFTTKGKCSLQNARFHCPIGDNLIKTLVMSGISSDQISRKTDFKTLKTFLKFGKEAQFLRLSAYQCHILQSAINKAYETHEEGERQKLVVFKKLWDLRTKCMTKISYDELLRIEGEKWMKLEIKPDPIVGISRQTDFQTLKTFLKFGEEAQFLHLSADQCQILQSAINKAYETHEEGERQKSVVFKKLWDLRTKCMAMISSEWVKSGYIQELLRIEGEKRMKSEVNPDPIVGISRQTDFQTLKTFLKFGKEAQFLRLNADQCQILQSAINKAYETHEEGERQKSVVFRKLWDLRTKCMAKISSEWVRIEREKGQVKPEVKPDPIPQGCGKGKPWFSRFSSWIKSKIAKSSLNEIEEDELQPLNHSEMEESMKFINTNIQKQKTK